MVKEKPLVILEHVNNVQIIQEPSLEVEHVDQTCAHNLKRFLLMVHVRCVHKIQDRHQTRKTVPFVMVGMLYVLMELVRNVQIILELRVSNVLFHSVVSI